VRNSAQTGICALLVGRTSYKKLHLDRQKTSFDVIQPRSSLSS